MTQLELSSGSTLPLPHFVNVLQVEVCVVKSLGSVWSGRSRRARVFHTLYLSATGEAAGRPAGVADDVVDCWLLNASPGSSPSLSWSPSNTCPVSVISPGAPISSERG